MVLGTPQSVNVNKEASSAEILGPVVCDMRENMEEMEDLFPTPGVSKVANQVDETDIGGEHITAEQSFDNLVGRPTIKRNYSRQSASKKEPVVYAQREENEIKLPKTDIQEWVEKVNLHSPREVLTDEVNKKVGAEISDCLNEEMFNINNHSDNVSGIHALDSTKDSVFSTNLAYSDDEMSDFDNFVSIPNLRNKRSKSYTPQGSSDFSLKRLSGRTLRKTLCSEPFNFSFDFKKVKEDNHNLLNVENVGKISTKLVSLENMQKGEDVEQEKTDDDLKNVCEKPSIQSISRKSVIGVECKRSLPMTSLGSESFDSSFNLEREKNDYEIALRNVDNKTKRRNIRRKSANDIQFKKIEKKSRKTLGDNNSDVTFNIEVEKERLEMEEAFKNFDENPTTRSTRGRSLINETVYEDISMSPRRTLGNETFYLSFNLEIEKEKLEMKKAFEAFQDEPKLINNRGKSLNGNSVKMSSMGSRKTMGGIPQEVSLNIEMEKERVESEKAFENFEEKPVIKVLRGKSLDKSELKSKLIKMRKTLGAAPQPMPFDFDIEKERVETEKAFENFEEEPTVRGTRGKSFGGAIAKETFRNRRKTMGAKCQDISFDIKTEKQRAEMEKDFQNFDEKSRTKRTRSKSVETIALKTSLNKIRKTMGTTPDNTLLDVEVEKERIEKERIFENFQEKPSKTDTLSRSFYEHNMKRKNRNSRKTIDNAHTDLDISFNVEIEKERIEMERVFENFDEMSSTKHQRSKSLSKYSPRKKLGRTCKTMSTEQRDLSFNIEVERERIETDKAMPKSRKTMGAEPQDVSFDIESEKERIEFEKAFENFKSTPTTRSTKSRSLVQFTTKEASIKSRKTMADTSLNQNISFDIQTEKERVEFENAFKNFEEKPKIRDMRGRSVGQSSIKETSVKLRKTMLGYDLHDDKVSFDIKTEKERIEFEKAFENFEEKPFTKCVRARSLGEPVQKTKSTKPRKTMGFQSQNVFFDIESEKERVELEKAFENFEEKPTMRRTRSRSVDQFSSYKTSVKPRKTIAYTSHDQDITFNIETEKKRVDIEKEFQNFEEKPNIKCLRGMSIGETVPKTTSKKIRKTMGIESQDVFFDAESEKKRVELEKAFEKFEENPMTRSIKCRSIGQSTPKKKSAEPRKSAGYSPYNCDLSFNIETKKERVEMRNVFQNFNFQQKRNIKCTRGQSAESYNGEIEEQTNGKENALKSSMDEVTTITEGRDRLICTSISDGISAKRMIMGNEPQDVSFGLVVEKRKMEKSENGGIVEEIKGDIRMSCQNADASEDYESTYSFMELDAKSSNVKKAMSSTPTLDKNSSENKGSSAEVKDFISEKCHKTIRSLPSKNNLQTEVIQEERCEGKIGNVSVNTPIEKQKKVRPGRKGSKALNNLRETDDASIAVENNNKPESLKNSFEKVTTNENSRSRRTGKTLRSVNKSKTKERKTGNDSTKTKQDQQEHESEEEIVNNLSNKIEIKNKVTKENSSLTEVSGSDNKPVLRRGGRLRNNNKTGTIITSPNADTEEEVMRLEERKLSSSKVGTEQTKGIRKKADKENSSEKEQINVVSNVNSRSRKKLIENCQKAKIEKDKVSQENSEKAAQDAKQSETSIEIAETKSNCVHASEIVTLQSNTRNARKPNKVGFKLEQEESLEAKDNSIINVEMQNKIINDGEKTEELLYEVNNSTEATTKRRGRRRMLDNTEVKQTAGKRIPPKNVYTPVIDPTINFETNITKEEDKADRLDKEQLQKAQKKEEVASASEVEMVSEPEKSELLELESKAKRRGRQRKTTVKQITSKINQTQDKNSGQIEEQISAALENESNNEIVRNHKGRRNKIEGDTIEKTLNKPERNVIEEKDEITQINSTLEIIEHNKGQSDFTESKEAGTRKTRNLKKTIKVEVKHDLEGIDKVQNVDAETETVRENKDAIEIKGRRVRGVRRVEVKEEVVKDSPVTRSLRTRRANQQKLAILQDTCEDNSKNLEIKEDSVNEENKKIAVNIRKRERKKSVETSNTIETSTTDKQRKDVLLLSETESEEIPRKKRVVGRKQSNKENVGFEDGPIEKSDESKSKSGVHTLRSRTRRKENNLLEISADELTPIKPTANAHEENVHISTPITEQSNDIEFKTPVNVALRARRCLRSNSTNMSTPKLNGAQEQLSRQDLSRSKNIESAESKNKSEKEVPTLRRGKRLNSAKENVLHVETDEEEIKGKNEVGILRTRAGRRKKELESDVNAQENLQNKKTRRNVDEKDKSASIVHVVDTDEEKRNNKASKNESEKVNKNLYNTSEGSMESKENQRVQVEEPTADKALPTRSTRGKRKNVEFDICKEAEEVPLKRITRTRRK